MNHLDSLELRLSNERIRLSQAKTTQEVKSRKVWIKQIEKEIQWEKEFLSLSIEENLSDDKLLELLGV
jgi:hypothetical protein